MASKRKKSEFEENIELDATLVHAATIGLFVPCAIGLGMTADEALGRAYWLKRQSQEYITAVSLRVVEIENNIAARKSSEIME